MPTKSGDPCPKHVNGPSTNGACRDCYRRRVNGQLGIRRMLSRAQTRAKQSNLPFSIKLPDLFEVWPKDNCCPIFKTPFRQAKAYLGALPESPSLDRILPQFGYVKGNIAVISARANRIKSSETDPLGLRAVADWFEEQLKK